MNRRLSVASAEGTGSTVLASAGTSALPRAADRPEPAVAPLHVLVADNNTINQRLLMALLQSGGHRVTVATNGREAVEAVMREHLDIILMHVQMPLMDGIQATRHIRRLPPPKSEVPIVGLTADALPAAAQCYTAAGMDSYLSKPLTPATLFRTLRELTAEGRPLRLAADGLPTLDNTVIDTLRTFMSIGQIEALLTESVADIKVRIRRLQTCLDTVDGAGAAREAHDLVSVAGNCGAQALSILARDIERACKQGAIADALKRFERMHQIAASASSAIADFRDAMAEH